MNKTNVYVVPHDELMNAMCALMESDTKNVMVSAGVTEKGVDVWVLTPVEVANSYKYLGEFIDSQGMSVVQYVHPDLSGDARTISLK